MEVTSKNFKEVLEELDDVLESATFLAIDGEFTGLNSGPDTTIFDTPAQYYAKLRKGSMNFLLVQLGLSVFSYDKITNKYKQRAYNFYVFPHPCDKVVDIRFLCQASSIAFLAKQGFDFNKLFNHGIPYLTKNDEEKLNKKLERDKEIKKKGLQDIEISDEEKPYVEDICQRIQEYINSDEEPLVIDKCNGYMRRIIYQEARKRWYDKVRIESKHDNNNHVLVVTRLGSKEEEQQLENEKLEKEKQEVQRAVGLTALLNKIVDSGKLIVGHNMLLDLCFIINQFFGSLPEDYSEFKALVHNLFPNLMDTKIICQSPEFREHVPASRLDLLLEALHEEPFSIPVTDNVEGRSYSLGSNDKLHEAGYDAYITGVCFIGLINYLGSLQSPRVDTVLPDSPLINDYKNKLLIAKLRDYPYISLLGKDPSPCRDHVFHITFPDTWKTENITELFTPYGGVLISWINDTSAYAALYRRDQIGSVVKNLFKSDVYMIKRYKDYQAQLGSQTPAKQERKRKISDVIGAPEANSAARNTTEGSNSTTPNQSNDQGVWEMASGNESSQSTPRNYASVVKSTAKTTTTMTPMRLTTMTMTTTATTTSMIAPMKVTTSTTSASKSVNKRKSSPSDGFSVVQRGKSGTKTKSKAASANNSMVNFSDPTRYQALAKLDDNHDKSNFESARNRAMTTPTLSKRRRSTKPRQHFGRLRVLARIFKRFFLRFSLLRFVSICFALFAVYFSFKFGYFEDDEL